MGVCDWVCQVGCHEGLPLIWVGDNDMTMVALLLDCCVGWLYFA